MRVFRCIYQCIHCIRVRGTPYKQRIFALRGQIENVLCSNNTHTYQNPYLSEHLLFQIKQHTQLVVCQKLGIRFYGRPSVMRFYQNIKIFIINFHIHRKYQKIHRTKQFDLSNHNLHAQLCIDLIHVKQRRKLPEVNEQINGKFAKEIKKECTLEFAFKHQMFELQEMNFSD